MTITLELPADLEARFLAEARATGLPVGEVVKNYLYGARPALNPTGPVSEDLDRALDEAADLLGDNLPPLSDEAMSRETIYGREDDWNR